MNLTPQQILDIESCQYQNDEDPLEFIADLASELRASHQVLAKVQSDLQLCMQLLTETGDM